MYFVIINRLLKQFDFVDISHMPRAENQKTNDLEQITSDYKVTKGKLEDLIEVRGRVLAKRLTLLDLSTMKLGFAYSRNFEVFTIERLNDTNGRKSIVDYLEKPIGLTDHNIKYHSLCYVLIGNELFKKASEGILLKCLGECEAYLGVSNIHSGVCGAHQDGHKMKWLLVRQGV